MDRPEGSRPTSWEGSMAARESKQAKTKEVPAAIAAALATEGAATALKGRNGSAEGQNGSSELIELLSALQAMRAGDFSVRMSAVHHGIAGKIADTFNDIVAANERLSRELERVGDLAGREG